MSATAFICLSNLAMLHFNFRERGQNPPRGTVAPRRRPLEHGEELLLRRRAAAADRRRHPGALHLLPVLRAARAVAGGRFSARRGRGNGSGNVILNCCSRNRIPTGTAASTAAGSGGSGNSLTTTTRGWSPIRRWYCRRSSGGRGSLHCRNRPRNRCRRARGTIPFTGLIC